MVNVNPKIMIWAREAAGLSLEEACRKLQFKDTLKLSSVEKLVKIELGEINPTRSVILRMAKQYHRPLITFYLAEPPPKTSRGQDFRTFPGARSPKTDALVDVLLRNIQVRQSIVRESLIEEEEAEVVTVVKSIQLSDGIPAVVNAITKKLNFKLTTFRQKNSPQDAFVYLRECVENLGIYVLLISDLGSYHTKLSLNSFRGFTIADEIAPFIVINDQDSKAAWSFTLIHEITHLFLGQTGISNQYFDQKVEKFCNDVASEILLPEIDLSQLNYDPTKNLVDIANDISKFAERRNISSSLVAYKLVRKGVISLRTWESLNKRYIELWTQSRELQKIKSRSKTGGPDYYILHRFMIGRNLISTVRRMMADGYISTSQAGKVLGVKPNNIQKLMDLNGLKNISRKY